MMQESRKNGTPRYPDNREEGVPSDMMEPSATVQAKLARLGQKRKRYGAFSAGAAGDAIAASLRAR